MFKSASFSATTKNELLPIQPLFERIDFDAKRLETRPRRFVGSIPRAACPGAQTPLYVRRPVSPKSAGELARCKMPFQGIDSSSKFR